ncbi:MAG: zinc transporter ZupT [Planctomycetota bacterium]
MDGNVGYALLLTLGAGLSTAIGGLIALAVKKPGPRFMGFTLGFSAGVMVHVSFVELLPHAVDTIDFMPAHLAFFVGMGAVFLIDFLVPHAWIGQHDHTEEQGKLMRTGLLVALGIGIHNFPEGLATFAGAMKSPELGVAIAVAIAIHNIPEGLAVAAPVYAATGSRKKAFGWTLVSGLSEPAGALVAALLLGPFLTEEVLAVFLALVAGFMVAIALDELVPAAKSFESEHSPILGVIAGAAVMALSLWLLG